MTRRQRLSLMALILLMVWSGAKSSSLEAQVADGQGPSRFTKDQIGVISDNVTGLDWYIGPNQDNNWH